MEQFSLIQSIITIDDQRQKLNEIVKYFQDNELGYSTAVSWLAKVRKLPVDTLKGADVFFIDADRAVGHLPQDYRHDSYGICKDDRVIYAGRMVYPVKDVKGNVMGFVGWDPGGTPKYLDSKGYGYKAKRNTLYGMEKLKEYYESNKVVVMVEGIVDCLLLRSLGIQSLATLGSAMSTYIITILKRFGNRLIVIPDNDNFLGEAEDRTAGEMFAKSVFYNLPEARVYQTVNFKDLDDVYRKGTDEQRLSLLRELENISNMFYLFTELRQRTRIVRRYNNG